MHLNINFMYLLPLGYPWETVINAELFVPLGMTSCGFGPQHLKPNQPWPHQTKDGAMSAVSPGPSADNPPTLGPAGSFSFDLP